MGEACEMRNSIQNNTNKDKTAHIVILHLTSRYIEWEHLLKSIVNVTSSNWNEPKKTNWVNASKDIE